MSLPKKFVTLLLLMALPVLPALVGCTTQPAAPAGGAPQAPQVLRISVNTDVLFPGNPTVAQRHLDRVFAHPAIETLVRLDAAGNPQPWLATGWQVDSSARTVTLSLRQGVKFHDGTDFDAAAVKWNLDQYLATKRQELGNVQSVEVVDDHTVRLVLKQMDSLQVANLASFPGMMISPAAFTKNGKEWADANPVGTGPFKFVEWQRDVKMVYEKFDGYWQEGKPYLDRVEFIIIADPMVQVAALQKGDVDVIAGLDARFVTEFAGNPAYKLSKAKIPMQLWGLFPDSMNQDSPLSNVKVRQAIWHAIDQQAITDTLGRGYWEPLNQSAVRDSWVYNPEVKGYPYDPARAKELLAEAGYADGFKITLNGLSTPPNPDVLTAVQGYLAAVGIDATVDAMDKGRFDQMVAGGGGWQHGLTLVSASVVPNEFGFKARLLSRQAHPRTMPVVEIPPQHEDLLDEAIAATDDDLRNLVHEIQKVETDQHATLLWLYATTAIGAKKANVQGDGLYETLYTQWTPEDARITQ